MSDDDVTHLMALIGSGDRDAALGACIAAKHGRRPALRRAIKKRMDEIHEAEAAGLSPGPAPLSGVVSPAQVAARVKLLLGGITPGTDGGMPSNESPDTDLMRACLFSLHDAKEARARGFIAFPEQDLLDLVAARRGRAWADEIAEAYLAHYPRPSWRFVRRWMKSGLCSRPTHEAYWHGMIANGGLLLADGGAELLAERDLFDDVFRLFEIEGTSDCSFAADDKYGGDRWRNTLLSFAENGHLSRERLLDATLAALERDYQQFRAGWFSRFHDALVPSLEEMTPRAERYLRLLGSRIPPTVSLAIRAARALEKGGALDGTAFIAAAEHPLRARAKSTVKQTLTLLGRVAKADPAQRGSAVARAATALTHEAAEVQAAALKLIERWGTSDDDSLRAAVTRSADGVSVTLRERVARFLGTVPAEPEVVQRDVQREPAPEAAPEPGPLDRSRALVPITSFEELVDSAAGLLEAFAADQMEHVLDAMVRLGPPRDAAQRKLAAPLAQRARNVGKADFNNTFLTMQARVIAAWAGESNFEYEGYAVVPFKRWVSSDGWYAPHVAAAVRRPGGPGDPSILYGREPLHLFIEARFRALVGMVKTGRSVRLLSTPTHAGGWIEPVVLVERMRAKSASEDVHDHVLALLRLAPDGRERGLRALGGVRGILRRWRRSHTELEDAVRYALGGEVERVGPTAALWIAAARARAPFDDDPRVGAVHAGLGPDASEVARYTLPDVAGTPREEQHYSSSPAFVVREPWPPRVPPSSHFTVLAHGATDYSGGRSFDGAWLHWWATANPANREPLFATAMEMLLAGSEVGQQVPCCAHVLQGPDVRWDGLAPHLLAAALSAPSADVRGIAVDVLDDCAARGRPTPDRLGVAIAWTVGTGRAPWGRFAKSLAAASALSHRHAAYVADAMEAAFETEPAPPTRGLAAALDILLEARARTTTCVEGAAARAYLEGLRGKRTASVASALLALERPGG